MLKFCLTRRKEIAAVIVYSVSRFSRMTSDHLTTKVYFHKLGIALRSFTEPVGDTPAGRFAETVMSASAQLDNEIKGERTTHGMQAAINAGKWVHRAPLGYVNADVQGD